MSGDDGDRYASIPERITWTVGIRGNDKHLLGVLSTFASFKTGKGARMSIEALVQRSGLPRRTVERRLQRLEAEGWIVAVRRRHKRATIWDINVERLATNWVTPKIVSSDNSLSATDIFLPVKSGGQDPVENARPSKVADKTAFSTVKSGGQIPCTFFSDPQNVCTSAIQLSLGPVDVGKPDTSHGAAEASARVPFDATGRGTYDAADRIADLRAKLATPLPAAAVGRRRHGA